MGQPGSRPETARAAAARTDRNARNALGMDKHDELLRYFRLAFFDRGA